MAGRGGDRWSRLTDFRRLFAVGTNEFQSGTQLAGDDRKGQHLRTALYCEHSPCRVEIGGAGLPAEIIISVFDCRAAVAASRRAVGGKKRFFCHIAAVVIAVKLFGETAKLLIHGFAVETEVGGHNDMAAGIVCRLADRGAFGRRPRISAWITPSFRRPKTCTDSDWECALRRIRNLIVITAIASLSCVTTSLAAGACSVTSFHQPFEQE